MMVAPIAHDAKEEELVGLARRHREALSARGLVATGTTGSLLRERAVVFLRDPLTAHPHEPDIQALLRVCDARAVPVATNRASAEILLDWIGMGGAATACA